jgi:hypothetical protein
MFVGWDSGNEKCVSTYGTCVVEECLWKSNGAACHIALNMRQRRATGQQQQKVPSVQVVPELYA